MGCGIGTPLETINEFQPKKLYKGHVQTTARQKSLLALGAGLAALIDPLRADMVAALGETTGREALALIRAKMAALPEGRRILQERPRINSKTVNVEHIFATCLPGSFGRAYGEFMANHGFQSDHRPEVRFIDDEELAYVMSRYREVHDFWHVLSGFETSVEAEIALKWFEFLQTGLPMTLLSGVVGPVRLTPAQWVRLATIYIPWAVKCNASCVNLMSVRYEELLERPLSEVRALLGFRLSPLPNPR